MNSSADALFALDAVHVDKPTVKCVRKIEAFICMYVIRVIKPEL
jgi:hypothetical protein